MIWSSVISGFSLGLIGSMHCVGMCGPLALALPISHLNAFPRFVALLLYQLGRVTTYTGFGFLFGIAGRHLYVAGIQQWLSIILGIIIVTVVVFSSYINWRIKPGLLYRFYVMVQKVIGNLLRSDAGHIGFYLMGMANGLLPCGMVYMAIAAALSSSEVSTSVLFMSFFGLGTLPAMMLVSYFGKMAPLSLRTSMRKAMPFLIATMGCLLILRGLNLNIPFISPEMPAELAPVVSCHS